MPDKQHIVVVCGYGCHLDTPLAPYLARVFRFVHDGHPNAVIFCGGYTQRKSAPGVSEAELMVNHTQLDKFPAFMHKVFLDTFSYTTFENIERASLIIRGYLRAGEHCRITIFCEATRSPYVVRIARHLMGDLVDSVDDITVETASWERDVSLLKLAWKYILLEVDIRFPWLGLAERESRKRRARAEFI